MNSNQIRETFLDFFQSKQHTIVPSAPMVIKNDPTLMFTNAGMNQFKDIFLGNEPARFARVADSQKCLRVSGKHNDLEEVGHDTYHHTMFEMLGNWSFGDYFKVEAIDWAWELLVGRFSLDPDRMYATVFEGSKEDGTEFDQQAYDLWLKYLPASHILRGNKKDNFWEMGETGPCGPCSEIHFDVRTAAEREAIDGATLVNGDHPQVIEVWNLVFMQYNRKVGGRLEPLPAQHVDTGMGFERLCMVIQGKQSNYDTDVFQPLIQALGVQAGVAYGADAKSDIALRVIADHIRTIAFSIADGQLPSNVKAGYVIRRILRRAVRYGYTFLGMREPFMVKLVGVLVDQMGGQFAELKANRTLIERVVMEEESSFLRTLETGVVLLDNILTRVSATAALSSSPACGGVIDGAEAFLLYDTYGFPIDLTELIAREAGVGVDIEGFERELLAQKTRSRNAASVETDDWVEVHAIDQSRFVGYDFLEYDIRISRARKVTSKGAVRYHLVFDFTPFYGNSGGQVGDSGYIECDGQRIEILDTIKENNLTIHVADRLPGDLSGEFRAVVDITRRRASNCNHTATHLMHHALRDVLGIHVEQKGSLVTPEYLRFDFSHFEKVQPEQLRTVEHMVNEAVRANHLMVEDRACDMDRAREMGAMMLFGEKYGDKVRVVKYGESVELCGGTHVGATGEIGLFRIVSEGSSASGIRRIEAVTAAAAEELTYSTEATLSEISLLLGGGNQYVASINRLIGENIELSAQLKELSRLRDHALVAELSGEFTFYTLGDGTNINVLAKRLDMTGESLKNITFGLKSTDSAAAAAAVSSGDAHNAGRVVIFTSGWGDKPLISVGLSDDLVARGLNAGAIVKAAAVHIKGGGGGQAAYATAGGKELAGLDVALSTAVEMVTK